MACINAAMIVAEGSFLNQTASLPKTSVYTVSSEGLYRISLQVTEFSGGVQMGNHVYWTDENGSWEQIFTGSVPPPNNPTIYPSGILYCVSSSNISIDCNVNGGDPSNLLFNARYVIEAL